MHRWRSLLTERFSNMDRKHVQLGIQLAYSTYLAKGALPCAAVAFIIKASKENLHVLLTKRASFLRNYGGDVCLPGGRCDPSDINIVNTALRETKEEVGIEAHDLDYICTFPSLPVGADKVTAVTPVVFLANTELVIKINTSEVAIAFWAPLDIFLNEHVSKGVPKSFIQRCLGKFSVVKFSYFDVESQTKFLVLGFTAIVCVTAASLALNKAPHFPFTMLTLVPSPSDGSIGLAEVVIAQHSSNVSSNNDQPVSLQSKL